MYNIRMSQTPITIKIDTSVKLEAQKLAKGLGLSLSSIIENKLKEVIRERKVVFSEELVLNKKSEKKLRQIELDIKAGRNISRPFSSIDEIKAYLNAPNDANKNT